MGEVKLHGSWSSPYSTRVIWVLELKGIPYEYIEEDFSKKSSLLLKYNPIHKKIPVLVHRGKAICESMIILEYIEETWPQNPLLPSDRYERAIARFWIKFADEKDPGMRMMFCTSTSVEGQKKAKRESLEALQIMEEMGLGKKKFFGGDQINLVDIAFGVNAHWFGVIEEALGVKLLEAHKFPRLHAWTENFKEVPIIRENLPHRDKLLILAKPYREKILASSCSN